MARVSSYNLDAFGKFILSRGRTRPYAEALRSVVTHDSVVLDIGAGTGLFSLLACQFGARQVHAVEPGEAIVVARQLARLNGYADRIVFHRTLSTRLSLKTKADVIVSDLRGILPFYEHHIPAIIDARQRLLAPTGVLIPECDTLWGSLLESEETYAPYVNPWLSNDLGLDFSATQPYVVNSWRKVYARPEQLLVPPQTLGTLDYGRVDQPHLEATLSWASQRAGTAHGVLLWFDTQLRGPLGFSSAPGESELIYGQGFFPLQHPIQVAVGDLVEVQISANLVQDDYVWCWSTRRFRNGQLLETFRQSTFLGMPLDAADMKRREAGYVPDLSIEGAIARFCLNEVDGATGLGEIARKLLARFPQRFNNLQDALVHVTEVIERYPADDEACSRPWK